MLTGLENKDVRKHLFVQADNKLLDKLAKMLFGCNSVKLFHVIFISFSISLVQPVNTFKSEMYDDFYGDF